MGRPKLDPDTIDRECIACHKIKPLGEFYSHKGMTLGKSYTCIPCDKRRRTVRAMMARGAAALRREIGQTEITLAHKKAALNYLEGDYLARI
jgi:hypothetical protein